MTGSSAQFLRQKTFTIHSLYWLLGIACALGATFSAAKPAQADPHAMFYTAIGQQQLFFNVLAALDQADFVEPSDGTFGRDKLVELREEVGFGPESNPALAVTKTNLASVLTRSITLEGNDLWSTYLLHQFSLEVVRRRNTGELLKVYCERGLGLKGCEEGSESIRIAEARKEHAYITDPLKVVKTIADAGFAAVIGAIDPAYDQNERRELLAQDNIDPNKFRPRNETVYALGKNNASNDEKRFVVNQLIQGALNFNVGAVDPYVYNDLTLNTDGTVELTSQYEADIDDYTGKLASILGAPVSVFSSVSSARNQQAQINTVTNKNGVKADLSTVPTVVNGEIGTINAKVRVPVDVKVSELTGIVDTLTAGELNPQFASTEENVPGREDLVDTSGGQDGDSGTVAGIQSNNSQGGRVLQSTTANTTSNSTSGSGANFNNIIDELRERPIQPANPLPANATYFTNDVIDGILGYLAGGSNRGGCNCDVDQMIAGYSSNILGN